MPVRLPLTGDSVRYARSLRVVAPQTRVRPHKLSRERLPAPYLRSLHFSPANSASATASLKKQISLQSKDPSSKQWRQLSKGQKVVRTASAGANAATILVGMLLTGAVFTFVYLEVIAPDSVTNWFNRAHERVKKDEKCRELLGDGRIKAFGEPTTSRWATNRPIVHSVIKDKTGAEHMRIHFNVEGNLNKGVVYIHVIKKPGESEFDYKYLYLVVAGHPRVYLENSDKRKDGRVTGKRGFLGVRWGW